jgi:hypothetical protein
MTSSSSRPSYKEAQERLLKWCQNVTRNYEVRLTVKYRTISHIYISSLNGDYMDFSFCSQSKYVILQLISLMVLLFAQ